MSEVIIDTNIFVLFILGSIDPCRIRKHRRTSIYNEEHYKFLVALISKYDDILICPNIVTEIDNLLNNFNGEDKRRYIDITKMIYRKSNEKYFRTKDLIESWYYDLLGITDAAVLTMAAASDFLISGDSELCDYARSIGIRLFDFKMYVNETTYK